MLVGAPLASYTSFRVGGPADVLAEVHSAGEIAAVVGAARALGLPYTIIGLGTNLLVLDGGVRGVVVRVGGGELGEMSWAERAGRGDGDGDGHGDGHERGRRHGHGDGDVNADAGVGADSDVGVVMVSTVVCGAGVPLAGLARAAAARGLAGLEFAEGIPGTVGGAVVMNAGAYGGEIGELVEWVEAVDLGLGRGAAGDDAGDDAGGGAGGSAGQCAKRSVLRLPVEEMRFGYRQSVAQTRSLAVTSVKLRLRRGEPAEIGRLMSEYAERRRSRQPLEYPSAGSFFRRPAGHYVGPMIESCGLKGFRVGGAEVSPKHANFIVNMGGATAADVLAVAAHVRQVVEERYGICLEPEVRVLGEGVKS